MLVLAYLVAVVLGTLLFLAFPKRSTQTLCSPRPSVTYCRKPRFLSPTSSAAITPKLVSMRTRPAFPHGYSIHKNRQKFNVYRPRN